MSISINIDNSVKAQMPDASFIQKEKSLLVKKEPVFNAAPIKNNKLSENNTDLQCELYGEIKQNYLLRKCIKEESSVQYYRNNLKKSGQDQLHINHCGMENLRKKYPCLMGLLEKIPTKVLEKHEAIDIVEHKVKSHVVNDNTVTNKYEESIPGKSSDGKDKLLVKGQEICKQTGNYECDVCDIKLSSAKGIRLHKDIVHKGVKRYVYKIYECDECHKMFSNHYILKTHINGVHQGIKKCNCSWCHKIFSSASNLKSHINSVHKKIKNFKCNECHKFFSHKCSLKQHDEIVHKGIKKWECGECHKMFSVAGNLNIHINNVHKKIMNYKCKRCERLFSDRDMLKKHIYGVHMKSKKLECDECHKLYSQKGQLIAHIDSVHEQIRMYECSKCHKKFLQARSLKVHIYEEHKGIINYECNFGREMPPSQRLLQTYIDSAHKGVKYECNQCGKLFFFFSTLKGHTERVHSK